MNENINPPRRPEFGKLRAGQAISQLGSGITAYALPLAAVLVLGATPIQMGMLRGISSGSEIRITNRNASLIVEM